MTDAEKAEYDDVIRQLMQKCEQLAAENTRLRSEKSDALSVCQEVYSDPTAPAALRLKAAGLALQFETPKLMPERAPLELQAEPVEPLADLVRRQRARADAILALPLEERSAMFGKGSNSQDD
jgi:hypothetical protein